MVKEKPSKSGNKTVSADHLRTLLRFMDLPRNINELKVKLVNINQWWAAKKKSEAENVSSQSRRPSRTGGSTAKPRTSDKLEAFETEKIDLTKKDDLKD